MIWFVWTITQYTDCCFAASQRVYHTIPASGSGSSGTNYDETDYGYTVMKQQNRVVTPGGTITDTVYDARGQVIKTYVGTNDDGATESDPTGGGADPDNNMVLVTANEFDNGLAGYDDNLTKVTQYATASDTRVTSFVYDWRDRRTDTDGEIDLCEKATYDNLDRVIKSERYNTTSGGNLIARSETKFDDRGRVYQTIRYAVNVSTGVVGDALTDNTWFDASGNVIKHLAAGSRLFTKTSFDSLRRETKKYRGFDLDETSYAEASSVSDDTILKQTEKTYNNGSIVIQETVKRRYHNATGTGELNGPSVQPKSRNSYVASYSDPLGRPIATADYGTNGGSVLSRPATVPARSDDVLVTTIAHNSAGQTATTANPGGVATCLEYDAVPRQTKVIMNCTSGSSSSSSGSSGCPESDDINVTVMTAYNTDGNVASLTAINGSTGNQTTQFVYGTTLSNSDVASSLLKRAEIYPDSVDANDRITFQYNRQRQVKSVTDQNGTIHAFDFDKLGRMTQDRVTTLGTGVDGTIRRIANSYEVRGMREKLTSWNGETVGSGSVVNEVQFTYNDFAQLIADYQSHSGTVNTATTPKVQYGYANGSSSSNTIRPTTMTYPNGRVLNFNYGATDSTADAASRIAALIDNDGTTHLADYSYLGEEIFVEVDYTEPDIKWTLVGTAGGNDPDTGDIYHGFDRFSRVKDNLWHNYASSTDVDRIKYGYDRNGNRTYRENTVATAAGAKFDEKYLYDLIDRLKHMDRGQLTALKDSITNKTFAQCWQLDATGNWKNFRQDDDGSGTWDLNQQRTDNEVNEITDISETAGPSWITPAYNRAGNMITIPKPADPTVGYTGIYDSWNRLVAIKEVSDYVTQYEYDGAKRRTVQKTYTAGTLTETRHLYYTEPSKWQVIEERLDSSTSADRQFVWGLRYIDDLILRDRDTDANGSFDERLYALQDANWNVTAITNASGTVQERYAYSAYGVPIFLDAAFNLRASSSFAWETLYAGYRWDAAIRHFQVRNRLLASHIGVWLQRDHVANHRDVGNLYEYCLGAPLELLDPLGLAPKPGPADPNEVARTQCLLDAEKEQAICLASVFVGTLIACYNICIKGVCMVFPPWCSVCLMGCIVVLGVGIVQCKNAGQQAINDCFKKFPLPKQPRQLACLETSGASV